MAENKQASEASAPAATLTAWKSLVTPEQVKAKLADPRVLVIDVRAADQYAAGHIPGAINLPGDQWRTPAVKAGKGDSQYIFRTADGAPDIARYEQLLGAAGLTRDREVIIYGQHAGKADGSVPAMILSWLGQQNVEFLDGIGLDRWKAAGYEVVTEPRVLAAAHYEAQPAEGFVWNLKDVLANLKNEDVIFYDTRSTKEYTGADKRDNAHGGHIPGAVLCNYEDLLDKKEKTTLSPEQVKQVLAERNISPDKTIVLYCQTATRVSLPYLVLKDLGYENVAIYDASWHEYGNREDTPIEVPQGEPAAK